MIFNTSLNDSTGKLLTDILKWPFNITGSLTESALKKGAEIGQNVYDSVQKTKIVPSIVSNQPYTTYAGYRETSQSAPTLTPWYEAWWNAVSSFGRKISDGVGNIYMGTKVATMKKQTVDTLGNIYSGVLSGVNKSITTLPDLISQKLNYVLSGFTGERTQDNTGKGSLAIIDAAPTNDNRPLYNAESMSLFDALNTSMKSLFNIGYQEEPVTVPVVSAEAGSPAAGGGVNWLLIAAIIAVLVYLMRRKKA